MISILLLFPPTSFLGQGGDKPFQTLETGQAASAPMELDPRTLLQRWIHRPLRTWRVLQATKIYQEDESYQTASGQFVTFTFTLADGAEYTVSACAPYVVIDGTGYRTDYEPCQALNMLGSQLVGTS